VDSVVGGAASSLAAFGIGTALPDTQGFIDIEIEVVAETGTAAGLDSQSRVASASAALFCPPLVWEVTGDIPPQPPASWQGAAVDEVNGAPCLAPCVALTHSPCDCALLWAEPAGPSLPLPSRGADRWGVGGLCRPPAVCVVSAPPPSAAPCAAFGLERRQAFTGWRLRCHIRRWRGQWRGK
jgi:hypothetical protein